MNVCKTMNLNRKFKITSHFIMSDISGPLNSFEFEFKRRSYTCECRKSGEARNIIIKFFLPEIGNPEKKRLTEVNVNDLGKCIRVLFLCVQ